MVFELEYTLLLTNYSHSLNSQFISINPFHSMDFTITEQLFFWTNNSFLFRFTTCERVHGTTTHSQLERLLQNAKHLETVHNDGIGKKKTAQCSEGTDDPLCFRIW